MSPNINSFKARLHRKLCYFVILSFVELWISQNRSFFQEFSDETLERQLHGFSHNAAEFSCMPVILMHYRASDTQHASAKLYWRVMKAAGYVWSNYLLSSNFLSPYFTMRKKLNLFILKWKKVSFKHLIWNADSLCCVRKLF